jgi:hypothetical protein
VAGHRDRDNAVAVLKDVATDAFPFVADDERDLAAEVIFSGRSPPASAA